MVTLIFLDNFDYVLSLNPLQYRLFQYHIERIIVKFYHIFQVTQELFYQNLVLFHQFALKIHLLLSRTYEKTLVSLKYHKHQVLIMNCIMLTNQIVILYLKIFFYAFA